MALTRDFKQTVVSRVKKDPAFAQALLDEALTLLQNGDPETAKLILRDLVNATVGFESLAEELHKPSKSLHRMLSRAGNPTLENFSAVLSTLRAYIKAMGGESDIIARIHDGSVRIDQFGEIDLPDQEPVGLEPFFDVPGSHHSESPDVRVVVYRPSQNPEIKGVELFRSELRNTTGRSTTPDANTTPARPIAA